MRPDVDVDGEVGDLHQEVFVLDAVHVVVAVEPVLNSRSSEMFRENSGLTGILISMSWGTQEQE